MKKVLVLAALALLVFSLPASSSRLMQTPVDHGTFYLQSAYCLDGGAGAFCFAGATPAAPTATAVPGVLCIDPGTNGSGAIDWHNFVTVASLPTDVTGGWFIKNVVLTKTIPEVGQCFDVYSAGPNYPSFNQQGSVNIRTWWPLMYEAPGTNWTLTVTSGTHNAVGGYYIFQDVWHWQVATNLSAIQCEIELFSTLAQGLCEIPLISDEAFVDDLIAQLDTVIEFYNAGNNVAAADALIEFENMVMEACNSAGCPAFAPARFVQVINTIENPVCCKLIVDAERAGFDSGIFVTKK